MLKIERMVGNDVTRSGWNWLAGWSWFAASAAFWFAGVGPPFRGGGSVQEVTADVEWERQETAVQVHHHVLLHTHSTKFPFSVLTNYLSERQTSLNWHPSLMNMQIRNPLKSTHDMQNHCCLAYICILKLDWLMFYDAITCRTLISIFPEIFSASYFYFVFKTCFSDKAEGCVYYP